MRAGRDVEVRRDAVEVTEALDVIEEDGLGRKADPAREAEERGVHGEPEETALVTGETGGGAMARLTKVILSVIG